MARSEELCPTRLLGRPGRRPVRRLLAATILAGVLVGCAGQAPDEPFTPPDFRPAFAAIADDYYDLGFLPDGMPGRRGDDGAVEAHPIYPVYVLDDWLAQHEAAPDPALVEAMSTVARAAVSRMEDLDGALVAMYEPGGGARLVERHYSALTQGYYASRLWRVADVTGDEELRDAARRSFEALLVPADAGGVLVDLEAGPVLEEVPQHPPALILNGWQSALAGAWEYYELSGDDRARELVLASTEAMETLLPLYDVPEVANSRYGLTGFVYVRVVGEGPNVGSGRIDVQGQPEAEVRATTQPSRWQSYVLSDDIGENGAWTNLRVNAVVSHAAATTLELELEGSVEKVEALIGDYSPVAAAPVDGEWTTLEDWTYDGEVLRVTFPEEVTATVAYPTNFLKEISGRNVNVYHGVHVRRLRELAAITGRDDLSAWAATWDDYVCRWADMELYEGLAVRDHRADDGVTDVGAACDADR